jgi:hypothetical protein
MVQLRGILNWYFLLATSFMFTHPIADLRTLLHLSMNDIFTSLLQWGVFMGISI